MVTIAVSYKRIEILHNSAIVNEIWECWISNAISKGIGPETRKHVYDDWKQGKIDILIPVRVWEEIR